jgi:three-Cys-motif partner protein
LPNQIEALRLNVVIRDDAVKVVDDGHICQDIGSWTAEKHGLVSLYAKLFSSGMKAKWDTRVYLELYAGAGYGRIRGTARVVPGSPIRALTLEHPFDKYIFCEKNHEFLEALKTRVRLHAPASDVRYVPGDCNEQIGEILNAIPRGSTQNRVLTLCFVDPPDIGIKFETIRKLSDRYMDFLVLLALYMDANRNIDNYLKEEAVKIDEFLGSRTWRDKWKTRMLEGMPFTQFLAEAFSNSMETLAYQPQPFYKMKPVTISELNVRLYRLALFSRHTQAYSFWDQVLKYSTPQKAFNFEESLGE